MPTSWASFEDALRELGRRRDDVEAVVLTHAHFDHIGFAERARTELRVPVFCHEKDVPLTRHPLQYAHAPSRLPYLLKPKAMPVVAEFVRTRAFFPKPVAHVERYSDGTLPGPGSPRVVFTPGHTLGHCSLHFPDRDAVIAGDAVVTFNPYLGEPGPQIVAGAATADPERNLRSLDALAETGATTVLCGHGEPWTQGAREIVTRARGRSARPDSNGSGSSFRANRQASHRARPWRPAKPDLVRCSDVVRRVLPRHFGGGSIRQFEVVP